MFIHRYKTIKKHLLNGETIWWYQESSWCGKRRILGWSGTDIVNKNWLDKAWVRHEYDFEVREKIES
ncbi:hypothetical protein [Bacillus sp. AK128]